MQGKQVTAYVGARLEPSYKRPVGADKIVKSWAATQSDAESEKNRLEEKYDAIVWIE